MNHTPQKNPSDMKITATTDDGRIFPLDVSGDLTISDLKASLEIDTGLAAATMVVVHNMNPCSNDSYSLTDCGISEGDIVLITTNGFSSGVSPPTANQFPAINWGEVSLPPQVPLPQVPHPPNDPQSSHQQMQMDEDFLDRDDPVVMRQYFASNPAAFAHLEENNPPLAEALLSGNEQVFADCWRQVRVIQREQERERIRMLNADPYDPVVQARIASEIDQTNISENLAVAIEHNPESFGRVVMLYISCQVNGIHVKALVDSGAASTIMSARCAERCGIMRLVDRRFAGIAVGIGRQNIIGRVHVCQVQIGGDFLASSFQVLEDQVEDMLLGLDMLKRHQVWGGDRLQYTSSIRIQECVASYSFTFHSSHCGSKMADVASYAVWSISQYR